MFAWPKHNHAILCSFCLEWAVNAPFEKEQKERYVFDNVPGGRYISALRRPESSPGCHVLLYVRRQIMSLVLQYLAIMVLAHGELDVDGGMAILFVFQL